MKTIGMALAALGLLAGPVLADKKLDEALAKAESQLEKGRADEALKGLQKAASQAASGEGYVLLSRFQARLGSAEHLEAAAASANKAVELATAPDAKADALANQVSFDLTRGSGREALAHAEEAVKAQETPTSLAALARAQARIGNPVAALSAAQRAVQAGADSAAAHNALGEALLASGKRDQAASAFRKAAELDPKLTAAQVGLAEALFAQNKPAEAIAVARKATESDKGSAEAFAVLSKALLAENKSKWAEAIEQAQQGAFVNPRSTAIQIAVGQLFEANGNLEQATIAYGRALAVDSACVPCRVALVRAQIQRGETEAALVEVRKLVADAPQSADAHLQLGKLLVRKKDYANALPPLEQAAALDPSNGDTQGLLGAVYQFNKKTEKAAAAYKRAVELAPSVLEYKVYYGLLLGLTDDYDAGVAEIQKAIQGGYKEAAAWMNLGWIYRNMEPPKGGESVAAYKKALEIDPKSAQAALGLGWALILTRNHDEALAAFKKAMESDSTTTGESLDGTAWVYYFKKDMEQAKATLAKAQAAGRNDLRLKDAIAKYEEALQKGKEEAEKRLAQGSAGVGKESGFVDLTVQIKSKNAGVRAKAADALGAAGPEAVPHLHYAAGQPDEEWIVRLAAVRSLGRIGPAAKVAIPTLLGLSRANCDPGPAPQDPKKALENEALCEDTKREAKEALTKIQR